MADEIVKPKITDADVWANSAPDEDILVPYEKIDGGWNYANKPSFQYLNWFWYTQTAFYTHLNQNGIPDFDTDTIYSSSGFSKHEGILYQAFSDTQYTVPNIDSRVWRSMDFLNGLYDVGIDMPAYRDILVYNGGVWENKTPQQAIDMPVGDLKDVTDSGTPETILAVNNPSSVGAKWINTDINTLINDQLRISDFEDTRIDADLIMTDGEILQFRPYQILNEDDMVYEDQWRWQNTYYQGYVNYNNITTAPTEHKCIPASYKDVGGARMWVDDSDPARPIFTVNTNRPGYVPKPYNLKATVDINGMIQLTWTGTMVADQYHVYMDGNIKESTPQTSANISPGDNLWHVFYVTAEDVIDLSIYESSPSNYVMGKQR